jgi:hypothetical protein
MSAILHIDKTLRTVSTELNRIAIFLNQIHDPSSLHPAVRNELVQMYGSLDTLLCQHLDTLQFSTIPMEERTHSEKQHLLDLRTRRKALIQWIASLSHYIETTFMVGTDLK